jgi:hypothetical protein
MAHDRGLWHRKPIPDLVIAVTALHHDVGVIHADNDSSLNAQMTGLVTQKSPQASTRKGGRLGVQLPRRGVFRVMITTSWPCAVVDSNSTRSRHTDAPIRWRATQRGWARSSGGQQYCRCGSSSTRALNVDEANEERAVET